MAEAGKNRRGRSGAPSRQSRVSVRRIAHEREIVGNRHRRHAELLHDVRFREHDVRPANELDDAVAADDLREVLVRRADDHTSDAAVGRRFDRRRRERIVRLVLDHRPDFHSKRRQRCLERLELGEQIGIDAGARLVSWPETVAERLDDVIGGDADVRRAALEHAEDRGDDAADCCDFVPIGIPRSRHRVEVSKELVRAVDEVNVHANTDNHSRACFDVGTSQLVPGILPRERHRGAGAAQERREPLRLVSGDERIAPSVREKHRRVRRRRHRVGNERDHRPEQDRAGQNPRLQEQQACRDVCAVRETGRDDPARIDPVMTCRGPDEVRELERPAAEIVLVEHPLAQASEKAWHALLEHLAARTEHGGLRVEHLPRAGAGRARRRRFRAASGAWLPGRPRRGETGG